MPEDFTRSLTTIPQVKDFLERVLQCENIQYNLLKKICDTEVLIKSLQIHQPTILSNDFRHPDWTDERKRWGYRKDIINELITQKRLDKDDDMKFGYGGALPHSGVQHNKQAFLLIGLPASGKSGIAEKLAEKYGAIIVDSDYCMRKLPEFQDNPEGANLVHEEAMALTWNDRYFPHGSPKDFHPLMKLCTDQNANIVLPKIGNSLTGLLELARAINEVNGYDVHLILTCLDRKEATIRALQRFERTGRYVPLSLIFDYFANDPILNYFRCKALHSDKFKTFAKISTINFKHKLIDCSEDAPIKELV